MIIKSFQTEEEVNNFLSHFDMYINLVDIKVNVLYTSEGFYTKYTLVFEDKRVESNSWIWDDNL